MLKVNQCRQGFNKALSFIEGEHPLYRWGAKTEAQISLVQTSFWPMSSSHRYFTSVESRGSIWVRHRLHQMITQYYTMWDHWKPLFAVPDNWVFGGVTLWEVLLHSGVLVQLHTGQNWKMCQWQMWKSEACIRVCLWHSVGGARWTLLQWIFPVSPFTVLRSHCREALARPAGFPSDETTP